MLEVLSKPADQITLSDIEALIELEVLEGEQIEFKESLSTEKDSADPWMTGADRIGKQAKNAILEEAVAFANAHSGALLLGIGESEAKPSVAANISPVPRCADLAERLKLVFRDCVEPPLPRIEIFAVPTKGDDGVIVIRAGRSRLAPHRVTMTLVCPVRRSDRCEKMTMREIQDMTLNVSRGLERLEKRLSERSARFQQEFKRLETPEDAFGIRMTATPVGDDIQFERVFRQHSIVKDLDEPWHNVVYRPGSGETGSRIARDGHIPHIPYVGESMSGQSGSERVVDDDLHSRNIFPECWRPMLRAARAELSLNPPNTGLLRNSYREIHCDGLIEWGFVEGRQYSHAGKTHPAILSPTLVIPMFANLAIWAHRVRCRAGVPTTEYALEAEIYAKGGPVQVGIEGRVTGMVFEKGTLQSALTTFPRYSLGGPDEFNNLLGLLDRDFQNSYGEEIQDDQGTYAIQNWPE